MLGLIDSYLDRITMYRLVLYYLLALIGMSVILSSLGVLNYDPVSIVFTAAVLIAVSYITNKIFSFVFSAPTNVESVYITALILACILSPFRTFHDLPLLFFAPVLAIASKYIVAIQKKHIFNPVAIAVVLTSWGFAGHATWWIGNAYMTPLIVVGGLAVIRKTRREHMVLVFYGVTIAVISFFILKAGSSYTQMLTQLFFHSSFFFFAYVMLTEPLTTPPTHRSQLIYAAIVGFFFPPQLHFGSWYMTPEMALSIGNIFSYIVSPKQKLVLMLSEKIQLAPDIFDFVFKPTSKLSYRPGQYMEWTYMHPKTDSRGNRRYFTLASSPTEDILRIGVKFYPEGSSYKKYLENMTDSSPIVAGQLAGDFVLPDDTTQKIVFVAGGIGITPFRSMLKFLLDTNERRDIFVVFSNKYKEDIVYKDVLDQAEQVLGIKTLYTLTDQEKISGDWQGQRGRVTAEMIRNHIPDWQERKYYLSGPHQMVVGFEETLRSMNISHLQIKKDFFPGFV